MYEEDRPSECQSIRCMQQLGEWDRNAVEVREREHWSRGEERQCNGRGGQSQARSVAAAARRQAGAVNERASDLAHRHRANTNSRSRPRATQAHYAPRQCVAVRGPVPSPGPIMQWKQSVAWRERE